MEEGTREDATAREVHGAEGGGEDKAKGSAREGTPPGPWPPETAPVTTALMAVPALLGLNALLRKAPRRLPIFISLWVAIVTAVRRVVCCRCEYYGRDCSTLMGRWTSWILPPDEENPLTPEAFQLDFLLIGASFLYPLPQVKAMGRRYLAFYLAAGAVGVGALRILGCSRCPNQACFMNPRHRGSDKYNMPTDTS